MKPKEPTKEELILAAAADVFIEKGRDGARMKEIAKRAGINKTLLHYYFRSKENIYTKILEQVFNTYFDRLESSLASDGAFTDTLHRFIETFIDISADNPRIPFFMLQELSQGGKTVKDILGNIIKSGKVGIPDRLIDLVKKESDAGRIEKVDPFQFVLTLMGACIYYFIAEPLFLAIVRPKASFDRRRFISERKESIFNVLYYGLKKREDRDNE